MAVDAQLLWDEVKEGKTLVKNKMYEMEFNRLILINKQKHQRLKIIMEKKEKRCPIMIYS